MTKKLFLFALLCCFFHMDAKATVFKFFLRDGKDLPVYLEIDTGTHTWNFYEDYWGDLGGPWDYYYDTRLVKNEYGDEYIIISLSKYISAQITPEQAKASKDHICICVGRGNCWSIGGYLYWTWFPGDKGKNQNFAKSFQLKDALFSKKPQPRPTPQPHPVTVDLMTDSLMVAPSRPSSRVTLTPKPATTPAPKVATTPKPGTTPTPAPSKQEMTVNQLVMQPMGVLPTNSREMSPEDIQQYIQKNYPGWQSRIFSGVTRGVTIEKGYNLAWSGVVPSVNCYFNDSGKFNKYTITFWLAAENYTAEQAEIFFNDLRGTMILSGFDLKMNAAQNGWRAVKGHRIISLMKQGLNITLNVWFTDDSGNTF